MEGLFFNIDFGFIEGLVRGYRNGLLTQAQYMNLTQCDTLEDLKLQLSATEYANFLANVPSPLSTSIIQEKASEKLYKEFNYIRAQAVEPLAKFMDYITYGYMIDNVALMITGTIHERDRSEILERCHPLGWFDTLPALSVATDIESLYKTVLVDTPLAPYFKDCLSADDLDDLNIEIIRNTLFKAYLEDFYEFCQTKISYPGNEVMSKLLEFEADRRSINISLNSFDTELAADDKLKLLPNFGKLYPNGNQLLSRAEDIDQIKIAVEQVGEYKGFFDSMNSSDKTLEDHFYQLEMDLCRDAFAQQFSVSTIWSWIKSREQEVRNITWIAECIAQNQKERINNYIAVY
ncbi:H(+)-transporting V0 sector ATPase subunit d [Ascoidea rubescens DSM 1968]|uniref:V-type proton ATPase subunit n=1 Tax=Ascoidea rubescens DSM 1968 TaxID=1344418 RepID=A0A1D2VJ97_9ASCO|nr:subunit D of the five-subunit V0 integral membrane domain of vacuolar H+-ATPase [Ascoidea rubescens DSM 1968]ODV61623.1 subunit D of the five-subunit V0 integral membrane domain of vacuolar H+-ATPase [Ascoidea rubescens DSM 1968]